MEMEEAFSPAGTAPSRPELGDWINILLANPLLLGGLTILFATMTFITNDNSYVNRHHGDTAQEVVLTCPLGSEALRCLHSNSPHPCPWTVYTDHPMPIHPAPRRPPATAEMKWNRTVSRCGEAKPPGICTKSSQDLWLIYELVWLFDFSDFWQIADMFLNDPVFVFPSSLLLGKIKPQACGPRPFPTEMVFWAIASLPDRHSRRLSFQPRPRRRSALRSTGSGQWRGRRYSAKVYLFFHFIYVAI